MPSTAVLLWPKTLSFERYGIKSPSNRPLCDGITKQNISQRQEKTPLATFKRETERTNNGLWIKIIAQFKTTFLGLAKIAKFVTVYDVCNTHL